MSLILPYPSLNTMQVRRLAVSAPPTVPRVPGHLACTAQREGAISFHLVLKTDEAGARRGGGGEKATGQPKVLRSPRKDAATSDHGIQRLASGRKRSRKN